MRHDPDDPARIALQDEARFEPEPEDTIWDDADREYEKYKDEMMDAFALRQARQEVGR